MQELKNDPPHRSTVTYNNSKKSFMPGKSLHSLKKKRKKMGHKKGKTPKKLKSQIYNIPFMKDSFIQFEIFLKSPSYPKNSYIQSLKKVFKIPKKLKIQT